MGLRDEHEKEHAHGQEQGNGQGGTVPTPRAHPSPPASSPPSSATTSSSPTSKPPNPRLATTKPVPFPAAGRLLPLLLILTALSTLFLLLIYPRLPLPSLPALPAIPALSLSRADQSPTSRFLLHPEQHVHRPPQLRTYTFVLRSELRAPDGVLKRVLTVNGLFPGPTIELRSGDTLRVSVRNELEEGTALHWHGLRFADGTVSQDGTPGLTQCPIPPNGTYTYEFRTSPDQAGTYWYHSHGGAQRADGLWGGLVIHPPAPAAALQAEGGKPQRVHDEPRSRVGAPLGLGARLASPEPEPEPEPEPKAAPPAPKDANQPRYRQLSPAGDGTPLWEWDSELLLLIGDWFHREGGTMFAWYWNKGSGGNEPVPDNALLNGQQTFDCARSVRRITCTPTAPARPEYTLDPAKTYKLRLVNTGSLAQTFLSVDEHELVVVEADGTDVEPVVARELAIAPGQRYAVILRYVGAAGSGGGGAGGKLQPQEGQTFWLRHRLDQSCFKYPNFALDPQPKAVIRYSVPRSRVASLLGWLGGSPAPAPAAPLELQEPTTERWNVTEADEFDARLLQPLDPAARALPETTMDPLLLYVTTVKFPQNGHLPWGYVNRTSWRPNEREPLLAQLPPADAWLDPATGRPAPDSWGPHEYVVQTSRNETVVVDLIINNLEDGLHPFHLHGHHFWPLHVGKSARYGWGSYNWEYPPTLPTTAPAMRDTMVIPLRSHAVFRVKFDTPGMWLFHCHVLVHLKSGMAMTFDVMPDLVPERERQKVRESCAYWDSEEHTSIGAGKA